MKTKTFADRVTIHVIAGNGGDGCASFRREKYIPYGGPDGGDGGRGGHVFMKASEDTDSLLNLYYQPIQRAKHGGPGRTKQCTGLEGADLYILVPCGTQVWDEDHIEFYGEVIKRGDEMMLAQGGRGGKGNIHFKTSSHQAPREFTHGERGEDKKILMELKTVADVGLVGYPNAGKSTLLRAISSARPKVAAYPFTTLNPVIGTIIFDNYKTIKAADIPGLIKGAHQGIGLGHDFLRHIERTRFLIFILDMAGVDGRNPVDDYRNLKKELKLYSQELTGRPSLVVANKMDLPEAQAFLKEFIRRTRIKPLQISATEGRGIAELKALIQKHFFPPAP